MSSAEFTKPPLAPKPKIISHLSSVAVSKFPPSSSKPDILQNTNSMSRGPKPPIAPKPKLSADTEGRSSVHTNNNLNKFTNGKLISPAGELYEGNQCNTECSESEAGDEYIIVPETQMTNKDCDDFEHTQDQYLESSTENEVIEAAEEEEDHTIANDEEICNPEINEAADNDFSDTVEHVELDSDGSTEMRDCDRSEEFSQVSSEAPEVEVVASKTMDKEVDYVDDPKNYFKGEAEEMLNNLDLVKDNNEFNSENCKIVNGDENLKGSICEDIILIHLSVDEPILEQNDELPQTVKDELSNDAEVSPANNGNLDDNAEFVLSTETNIGNYGCANPDIIPNDADVEERDIGLGLKENELDSEEDFGESINEAAAEEEEVSPDSDKETNAEREEYTDDGYQTTEMKSEEETSETTCEVREDSEKEEVLKADNTDDSCQIVPFESECNDDVLDSFQENFSENLELERAYLNNDIQLVSPQTAGEPELEVESKSNVVVEDCDGYECLLEEPESNEHMLEGNTVSHSSFDESSPNLHEQAAVEDQYHTAEELAACDQSKFNADCNSECESSEYLAIPEVVVLPEEKEAANDSLDDPYVMPAGNVTPHVREVGQAEFEDMPCDYSIRQELTVDTENNLLSIDRKSMVTRTRSLSGKVPGYVPETVPEETGPETEVQSSNNDTMTEYLTNNFLPLEGKAMEVNRALPGKSRRFILYPRSYSVEGREMPVSVYRETDGCALDDNTIKRIEDNLSLPCVISSSGSFSQRNHLSSSGLSTPSSVVDIPPPFELACITKKPITKSSPSLLIENESPDKYIKKKKSSFKKFLTLKFKKKTENKVHVDVNVSSSRSSSESSYHGPSRVMELDRRSLSNSPQLKSHTHTGKLRASESPSTVFFYKDGKRKGTPKTFSRSVSRVESFEDRSRPPFMPLPLTKPRSISFPNADTSDYENIPAMSSDYENIHIPPRRPTRAGTFTEFFEDPSRALSAANENDGYVDMSSFTAFENKQQTTDQETESAYTEPYKVCPVSVVSMEDITSDEEQNSSEDEESSQGDPNLINKKGQSRAYIIAQELVSSEKVYVEMLQLLYADFYEVVLKELGNEDADDREEVKLKQSLCEIPEIYKLHQEILGELEERVINWEEHQKVADVFLSRKSRFNHHTAYIMQFDRNLALLDESCLKSSQLATVIRAFEQKPGGSPMSVKHQFLKMVQRIFQYRLLLTDYLNNLCPDSAEYEDTQAALLMVSEITDRANDSMQQGENLQKLVNIEHSVRGQSNLLQPGREFLKEGTLMKVSRKNRHPRHLFLMNDVLLYTYPQKDGKYRLKNSLAVSGIRVSCPVTEKAQNILKIEYAEHCLTLSASSCSERDEWYSYISRTILDDHKAHNASTFQNNVELRERPAISLGERPPTLVPVSHVMMCMNCGCDFTLTLRRHHCHACGKIVCRNCSRNKHPLTYLKDRPAKVCDGCYSELRKRERPVSVSFPPTSSRFSGSAFSSVFHNIHYSSFKKQKKIPSALMEVAASGEGSSISGYLGRCKRGKRHWKKLWFVIKGKVLYTYMANEDKVATESLPLLGFSVAPEKEEGSTDAVFHLYHKQILFYSFRAEDNNSAQRWIEAMEEATIL